MIACHRTPRFAALFITSLLVFIACTSLKAGDDGMAGWELGSEYNQLYNARELDRIRGEITKFVTIVPMPGMAPATAFYLDEGAEEPILVHLCPEAFADAKATGLRKGVKTKIRGSWSYIDDKDVFMASKVKQGEHFEFKVRLTSDGTPFWTMSPEELASERASQ